MKKRIISLVLVIVMAALSLASCTYSLAEDDLTQYASFNADAFSAIFDSVEIEDGDFTTNEETRAKKIADYIYKLLISAGSEAKTEGKIDADDVLTYCYYAVIEKDGNKLDANLSNMSIKNAAKLQLGDSDLTKRTDLQKAIAEEIVKLENIKDYVYATTTSGKFADGDIAYISYTVKPTGSETTTKYTNVKVVLSANNAENGDHQVVVDKLLEKKDTATIGGTALESFKNADESKEYTGAKVEWTVNKITEGEGDNKTEKAPAVIEIPVKLTEKTTFTCVDASTETVEADNTVTYYVYPVSYVQVEALSANIILDEIYSGNITKDTLDCFAEQETLVKDYSDKKTAYEALVSECEDLEEEIEDETDETKKAELEGNLKTKTAEKDAKKVESDAARDALVAAVTTDTLVAEYKADVKETLTEQYNNEIKMNLADAIWDAMVANVKINAYPEKLVDAIYQIMYDNYEYKFYTEEGDDDEESPYKKHNGSFESYLAEQTKTQGQTLQIAKDTIWNKSAMPRVAEMLAVYVVADHYGQLADKKAIKEYKKTADYKSDEASYGEHNALAAYQFDLLMDYFLTEKKDADGNTVKDPTTGINQYDLFKEGAVKPKTSETK